MRKLNTPLHANKHMGLFDWFKKIFKKIFARAQTVKPAVEPIVEAQSEPIQATKPTVTQLSLATASMGPTTSSDVLLQPMVTEKSTVTGTYCFKVSPDATKPEIHKAFISKYSKTPLHVNIVNVLGKTKLRGRVPGKRNDWKKAIIYLAKNEHVDLFQ